MRLFSLLLVSAIPSLAHEVRPAYLELNELQPGLFRVLWKVPTQGALRLPLDPVFPANCTEESPRKVNDTGAFLAERWTLRCPGGLTGQQIVVENLEITLTDALVRLEMLGSEATTARVRPNAPSFVVAAEPSIADVVRTYFLLGVEHILMGVDHLLFVFALLFIVEGRRKLLLTITAFTVSHSITLAMATLGFVHVPSAPVEAVIALSILFLATEIVHGRQGRATMTHRRPWLAALAFGLLHGFGFAGALAEIGLPGSAIPLALLLFNLGVEAGQIVFIAIVLSVWSVLRRAQPRRLEQAWAAPTYGIGVLAAYWTIERVAAFW